MNKKQEEAEEASCVKWKAVQKPYHKEDIIKKKRRRKKMHPSYPTQLNISLQKYSDDFYENFVELIQNTDQLFPKSKELLDEKVTSVNRALEGAAESNFEPRERIERIFIMTNKIKAKFEERDRLNRDKKLRLLLTSAKKSGKIYAKLGKPKDWKK